MQLVARRVRPPSGADALPAAVVRWLAVAAIAVLLAWSQSVLLP